MKNTRTVKFTKVLTNVSAALAAFAGGLGTLPIDSKDLPLPPEWRPYLMGVAFLAVAVRMAVIPAIDALAKDLDQ